MEKEINELSLEEMKSLISLSTLLPALLEKITSIESNIKNLEKSFNDIKNKFNNNCSIVEQYKASVDQVQSSHKDSIKDLEKTLSKSLGSFNSALNEFVIKMEQKSTSKNENKKTAKEDDKIKKYADIILKDTKGRKTRRLTLIQVKNAFNIDKDEAKQVLDYLEKEKYYNKETETLKFKK